MMLHIPLKQLLFRRKGSSKTERHFFFNFLVEKNTALMGLTEHIQTDDACTGRGVSASHEWLLYQGRKGRICEAKRRVGKGVDYVANITEGEGSVCQLVWVQIPNRGIVF